MHKDIPLRIYRLFFGLLVVAAIIAQLNFGLQQSTFSIVNFFSFFTIESNVFAALTFIVLAFLPIKNTQTRALWRGAMVVFMTTTGLVYIVLLSGLEESLQTPIPWVNAVLHYIMPIAVLIDWLIALPSLRIAFKDAIVWLFFPLAYVAYSLIREVAVDWAPYPFLNPDLEHGYVGVFVMSTVIAACLVGLVWFISSSTQWWNKKSKAKKAVATRA